MGQLRDRMEQDLILKNLSPATRRNYLISEYITHYHEERPHQSKDNLPLSRGRPPSEVLDASEIEIVCHTRLGELLRHYERSAA